MSESTVMTTELCQEDCDVEYVLHVVSFVITAHPSLTGN